MCSMKIQTRTLIQKDVHLMFPGKSLDLIQNLMTDENCLIRAKEQKIKPATWFRETIPLSDSECIHVEFGLGKEGFVWDFQYCINHEVVQSLERFRAFQPIYSVHLNTLNSEPISINVHLKAQNDPIENINHSFLVDFETVAQTILAHLPYCPSCQTEIRSLKVTSEHECFLTWGDGCFESEWREDVYRCMECEAIFSREFLESVFPDFELLV